MSVIVDLGMGTAGSSVGGHEGFPGDAPVADFRGFLDGGGRADLGLGGCGDDHDPTERLDDLIGPPPVAGQAKVSASAAAGEAGGDVQHLEPERLRLGGGEVTVEGE